MHPLLSGRTHQTPRPRTSVRQADCFLLKTAPTNARPPFSREKILFFFFCLAYPYSYMPVPFRTLILLVLLLLLLFIKCPCDFCRNEFLNEFHSNFNDIK